MEQSMQNFLFGGIGWLSVLTLFAIALFYFLAPVFHYSASNRFWIVASLWTLIIKTGLSFVIIAWVHLEQWDFLGMFGNQGGPFGGLGRQLTGRPATAPSTMSSMMVIGLPPLDAGLFVLALFLFVYWLTGLRRREIPPPD